MSFDVQIGDRLEQVVTKSVPLQTVNGFYLFFTKIRGNFRLNIALAHKHDWVHTQKTLVRPDVVMLISEKYTREWGGHGQHQEHYEGLHTLTQTHTTSL